MNKQQIQPSQHPSKSLINKNLIKKTSISKQKVKQQKTKQEIMTQTGMYFPDIVLMTITCDKKSEHSQMIKKQQQFRVTSHSFAHIPIADISKIKIYAGQIPKKVILKIQQQDQFKPSIFHVKNDDISELFSNLLWIRLATMNIFTAKDVEFQDQIEGDVMVSKTIEYFGKWELKKLKISVYKGFLLTSKQKISPPVHVNKLTQFWTRFQMIDKRACLVVKLMAGLFKYQIGIPISYKIIEWMQAFCSILKQ